MIKQRLINIATIVVLAVILTPNAYGLEPTKQKQTSGEIKYLIKQSDWFTSMVESTLALPAKIDKKYSAKSYLAKSEKGSKPISWEGIADQYYSELGREMLATYGHESDEFSLELYNNFFEQPCRVRTYSDILTRYRLRTDSRLQNEIGAITLGDNPIEGLRRARAIYAKSVKTAKLTEELSRYEGDALLMAIDDISKEFGSKYSSAKQFREAATNFKSEKRSILEGLSRYDTQSIAKAQEYLATFREAMLSNPYLDFDDILCIKRDVNSARHRMLNNLGFPALNSHNHNHIPNISGEWGNNIVRLKSIRNGGEFSTLFTPREKTLVTDLDLHFNGDKILFSSKDENDMWHVYEISIDGTNLTQITPKEAYDVNHFDACYLPDNNVVFTSDATFQGLPCENGSKPMSLLYLLDRGNGDIRQLTYEQDSDWSPAVLNDGRLMYLRWEYSDLAHYFSRILMTCNPDGTAQKAYYGSNSYFPNTYIFARAIPNDPTKVVGIVGGHHGISRSGRLMIIDPKLGRHEADGVVQEIPYRGREVVPEIKDYLVNGVWPQFTHPYPLNDKYFLVSAKLTENSLWGVYIVDTFNNMTLIKEVEGSAIFDPIPVKATKRPAVIPSKIDKKSKESTVFISDIYEGEGLKGLPKGAVKSIRLFSYHYAHNKSGGHNSVGIESSWDVKRIIGTVHVEEDGSVMFTVPANTPISIQPLDKDGAALQIMRSWFVGMPGEVVSCIGCHEEQDMVVPNKMTIAAKSAPKKIDEWYGPARPFSYRYEVQPVLDKYCIGCHNGSKEGVMSFKRGEAPEYEKYPNSEQLFFSDESYLNLHPYVRRPGPEGEMHILNPMEYHASTSELTQLLKDGHHNVKLDKESWERLYAWIDLNAPYRGKWEPPIYNKDGQHGRRMYYQELYAGVSIDPEEEFNGVIAAKENLKVDNIMPAKLVKESATLPKVKGWPLNSTEAEELQSSDRRLPVTLTLDREKDINITLMPIPKGSFIKERANNFDGVSRVEKSTVKKPLFMSKFEITNEIYALFNAEHDSRYISQQWKDHNSAGYPANRPQQPVIRVSWSEANEFCEWLSNKTGRTFTLPTEDEWEWSCRAGSDKANWFGDSGADYSKCENLSDSEVRKFGATGMDLKFVGDNSPKYRFYSFIPRDSDVDDGNMIVSNVGSYMPNPWGLYDMQGNVAEWTLGAYNERGNEMDRFYSSEQKVAIGGSWRDRAKRSTPNSVRFYEPYQKVYNVGFRVVMRD